MYSTCLHCHRPLGTNRAIEQFQVGRRLAFDAAKGRLWVVCPECARWNLSPIEERWEAVEDCERQFRGQKLRSQTENVGLVRLPDGTDLIRIGSPLRPEFAAWRYGRVFAARLHKRLGLFTGAGAIIGGAAYAASGSPLAAQLVAGSALLVPFAQWGIIAALGARRHLIATRVVGEDGRPLRVVRANLDHTRLIAEPNQPLRLYLVHAYGRQHLTGDRAARAVSTLLSRINGAGARASTVKTAASFIADAGDPEHAIERVSASAARRTANYDAQYASYARGDWMTWPSRSDEPVNKGALYRLPLVQRLALEMSLHEHGEQFALDQELESLERAWREAEEVAAIADNLLVPQSVDDALTNSRKTK